MLLFEKYSLTQIADACSVTPQAVWEWKRRGRVPAEQVKKLCALLRTRKPAALRPDLFDDHWRYKNG